MRILLVDDDIATVAAIESLVDWKKFHIDFVKSVYNIVEAKRFLASIEVEIIICDIEMPMGTGLDLLKWIRGQNIKSEFIILTCHENFHFAKTAIEYGANSYILKPLNIDSIEKELDKVVQKLMSHKKLELAFWRDIFLTPSNRSLESIRQEINRNALRIRWNAEYFFVLFCANYMDQNIFEKENDVFEYALSKMVSDIFLEEESEKVITYYRNKTYYILYVFDESFPLAQVEKKCKEMIYNAHKNLQCSITAYMSNQYQLDALYDKRKILEKTDFDNVIYKSRVLHEGDISLNVTENVQVLDMDLVSKYLSDKNKIDLLRMVKERIDLLVSRRKLNAAVLQKIKQDILQSIYVYLHEKNILADELFGDEQSIRFQEKSTYSYIDMMQYITFLVTKTYSYVNDISNSQTIIDRSKNFIFKNYHLNITRSDVADSVFLAPEYLAKIFLKEEGKTIKNFINEYRIEKAKSILSHSDKKISDIALDVGFDNIPYFTTKFREIVGISPSSYRHWHLHK